MKTAFILQGNIIFIEADVTQLIKNFASTVKTRNCHKKINFSYRNFFHYTVRSLALISCKQSSSLEK